MVKTSQLVFTVFTFLANGVRTRNFILSKHELIYVRSYSIFGICNLQYLVFAMKLLETLSKNDEQSKAKASFKLCISALLFYFAIIPTRLTCLKRPSCPGTEFVGTVLKFRKKKKNLLSCVPFLQKKLKTGHFRCCFAKDGKEMYLNV